MHIISYNEQLQRRNAKDGCFRSDENNNQKKRKTEEKDLVYHKKRNELSEKLKNMQLDERTENKCEDPIWRISVKAVYTP